MGGELITSYISRFFFVHPRQTHVFFKAIYGGYFTCYLNPPFFSAGSAGPPTGRKQTTATPETAVALVSRAVLSRSKKQSPGPQETEAGFSGEARKIV